MSSFGSRIDRKTGVPPYAQVRENILDLIQKGKLRSGDKLPPEPEVASAFGVSRMTANKAILALVAEGWLVREKGRGTFVSPTAGEPVGVRCAVAIPEDVGRALEDHYFGGLYWGLQSELSAQGMSVEPIRLNPALAEQAVGSGAGALVAINPPESALEDLRAFARTGAPVVVVGASWGNHGFSLVDSDNLLGAALAVNHLVDLGHRRVLFLGACPNDSNTLDRIRGFRTALKARGIDAREEDEIVVSEALGFDEGVADDLARRLASKGGPTAVFAAGAHLAMQTVGVAQRAGLRIPKDLSVVGYDDPSFLSLAYPPVTTIRQPLAQMAQAAREILADRLLAGDPRPAQRLLDPQLVIRGSTSALRT